MANRVTGTALAAHLDCTRETISDYVARKIISKLPDGKYDQDVCRNAVLGHLRGSATGGTAILSTERAALAREQTFAVQIKNAALRGDLVSLSEFGKRVDAMIATYRERVLSIPGKIADALSMRTREEIEPVLRGELYEALDELSNPAFVGGSGDRREALASAQDRSPAA